MSEIRVENWQGYEIRFVKVRDEWYAILKDICDALGLRTKDVSQRISSEYMERVAVQGTRNRPSKYKENYEDGLNDIVNSNNIFWMLAINETGVYEALFASRKLEARKFRKWSATVMKKLRTRVGLEQYEVMRMTETAIQDEIDAMLNCIFWDEEKQMVMESVNLPGGDVDQVPFEG